MTYYSKLSTGALRSALAAEHSLSEPTPASEAAISAIEAELLERRLPSASPQAREAAAARQLSPGGAAVLAAATRRPSWIRMCPCGLLAAAPGDRYCEPCRDGIEGEASR